MGSCLGWIIKGKFVLQAPRENAYSQSQERKDSKEAKLTSCAPTLQSYPI